MTLTIFLQIIWFFLYPIINRVIIWSICILKFLYIGTWIST